MCTIHLYTIILEQRLLQWWLKLHGIGLYPKSWIWKRKSKKTDSWHKITEWKQLSVLNYQSNYWNSWQRRFLDWCHEMTLCVKIRIHCIAGETSGCNNLVGYMHGGWPKFIYQTANMSIWWALLSHTNIFTHYIGGIETSMFDCEWFNKLVPKNILECPHWWWGVQVTSICYCWNVTCHWHWLTEKHVWLSLLKH